MTVGVFGGGAVGLAAGIISARAGLETQLIDPQGFETVAPTGEADARVWALGPRAIHLLERLGCPVHGPRVTEYCRMRVIDSGSDAAIQFGADRLGVIVEADWIRAALIAVAERTPKLTLQTKAVQALSWQGATVTASGMASSFDAVVLAEGRQATLATSLGFDKIVTAHGFQALVGTLACTEPHGGEAFQSFTAEGPLALLPLPDHNGSPRVSVVWSMADSDAMQMQSLSSDALARRLTQASEQVRGLLTWVRPGQWIPIGQHHLSRDALGPCVAIGDTSHGIFPLAGLGANLGFADVCAIEQRLATQRAFDPSRFARAVARERRLDHLTTARVMALLQSTFASTHPWARLTRSAVFRVADRVRPMKTLFQQLAG